MMRRQVVGQELASPRNPNLVLTRFRRLPEERERCLRLWDLEGEEEEVGKEGKETKLPKRSFSFSLTQLRRTLSSSKVETFRGGERKRDNVVGQVGRGWGDVPGGEAGGKEGRQHGLGARRVGPRAEDEIDRQGNSPSSLHSRFERDFIRKPRQLLEVAENHEEEEEEDKKELVKEDKDECLRPRVIQGQNNTDDWVWSTTTYII